MIRIPCQDKESSLLCTRMHKLSLKGFGWASVVAYELLNIGMLVHQAILGESELGIYHNQFIQILAPGYVTLDFTGVIIVLVEAFVYAWIFAAIFVWVYNSFVKE